MKETMKKLSQNIFYNIDIFP